MKLFNLFKKKKKEKVVEVEVRDIDYRELHGYLPYMAGDGWILISIVELPPPNRRYSITVVHQRIVEKKESKPLLRGESLI